METPAEGQVEASPPRRRLRLSVRALMVVVLVLAVVLGWFVHCARVQREAVAAIEKTGRRVVYDWQRGPNSSVNPNARPWAPRWLVDRLGVDYFGHVVIAYLGDKSTDAEMEHLGRLDKLDGFRAGQGVTDAGVAHIRGLTRLDHVDLSATRVTGAALANLRGMAHLRSLYLRGVRLSDSDLAHLANLTNLESLDLASTPVTDAGLAYLRGLVRLRDLDLGSTGVTGEGLAHLGGMKQLSTLRLTQSRVETLARLPPLPRLDRLLLIETPIDDAGLAAAPRLDGLTKLYLMGTRVTGEGLRGFRTSKGLRLMLNNTKGTDAGASAIATLEGLDHLILDQTDLTDAGLAELARSPSLTRLDVSRTRITDAGLEHLAGFKNLKSLKMWSTKTTPAGLARLRNALPRLSFSD